MNWQTSPQILAFQEKATTGAKFSAVVLHTGNELAYTRQSSAVLGGENRLYCGRMLAALKRGKSVLIQISWLFA